MQKKRRTMNTELTISAALGSIITNSQAVETLIGMISDLGLEISDIKAQNQ